MSDVPRKPTSAVAGWRLGAYLVAEATSSIGSWALIIALWGVAAYRFDVGPVGTTLLGLTWMAPSVLLGPFIGVLIDRHGPRRVLIAADVFATVGVLVMTAATTFPTLVALSFLHGIAWASVLPAVNALPPAVVADRQLARANAVLRLTSSLAIVVGPALGGAVIAAWGFRAAFVVDAASYVVGLAGAILLRPPDGAPQPAPAARGQPTRTRWQEAAEGLAVVRASPVLRRLLTLNAAVYLLYGAYLVFEPLYVKDVLGRPTSTFAQLQSSFGVALLATGLVVVRFADRLATLRNVALAVAAGGAAALLYLATRQVALAFVGVTAWGAAAACFSAPSATVLQRASPAGAQGRVIALDRSLDGLTKVVAMLSAGTLASLLGVRAAAMVFAGLTVTVGLAGLAAAVRSAAGSVRTSTSSEQTSPSPAG